MYRHRENLTKITLLMSLLYKYKTHNPMLMTGLKGKGTTSHIQKRKCFTDQNQTKDDRTK